MLKIVIIISLLLGINLFGSSVNVAVAANVSYAIKTLTTEFNKTYPDIKINITLASSGKLTAQINNGAPYDIFMSANMKYPNSLYADKVAITKPVIYAQGALAYFSVKKRNFIKGIEILLDKNISTIAIANPKTAPYGKASLEAINNSNLLASIKSKLVYAQSISQTLSYVVTAADIGFIAKSSMYSSHMSKYKKGVNWIDVNSKLYTPIKQGIVILKRGGNNNEVKVFYDYILSKKAKKIFKDFGYMSK